MLGAMDTTLTRDERLLQTLLAGETGSSVLASRSGIPERTVRDGLRRLIGEGLVFSKARGRYRLTGVGRRVAGDLPPVGELVL